MRFKNRHQRVVALLLLVITVLFWTNSRLGKAIDQDVTPFLIGNLPDAPGEFPGLPVVAQDVPATLARDTKMEEKYVAALALQKRACGSLCEYDSKAIVFKYAIAEDLRLHEIKKPTRCKSLFEFSLTDVEVRLEWPPPIEMPLRSEFTLGDRVAVQPFYMKQLYAGTTAKVTDWGKTYIEALSVQLDAGTLSGSYGFQTTNQLYKNLKEWGAIPGKRVLVVGSEKPWVEVVALKCGAAHVTTLEYGKITTDHPQMTTYTTKDFAKAYLAGEIALFDVILSYSSLEHSGLARYGDAINPWGDIMEVAKISCTLKDGGIFFAGFPAGGTDVVYYNAHRRYGPLRLPLLFTNFVVEEIYDRNGDQPLFRARLQKWELK